jgi:spore coat protein U-like protein
MLTNPTASLSMKRPFFVCRKMFRSFIALLGLLAGLGFVSPVFAAITQVNLSNTSVVPAECLINVSQNLNFGVYDPLVTHRTTKPTAQGMIRLNCALGTNASVRISNGNHSSAYQSGSRCTGSPCYQYTVYYTYSCARRMSGNGGYISYDIGPAPGTSSNNTLSGEYTSTPSSSSCTNSTLASIFSSESFNGFTSRDIPVYGTMKDATASAARPGVYSLVVCLRLGQLALASLNPPC